MLMACLFCMYSAILAYHIWILLVSLTALRPFQRGSNTCPAYCAGIFYIWLIVRLIGWYKGATFVKVERERERERSSFCSDMGDLGHE